MPSDDRSAVRRLRRRARPLKPATDPYYCHNPKLGRERYGPGWYYVPAGASEPVYLGVNQFDADIRLHEIAAAAEADEPAGASVVALPRPLMVA